MIVQFFSKYYKIIHLLKKSKSQIYRLGCFLNWKLEIWNFNIYFPFQKNDGFLNNAHKLRLRKYNGLSISVEIELLIQAFYFRIAIQVPLGNSIWFLAFVVFDKSNNLISNHVNGVGFIFYRVHYHSVAMEMFCFVFIYLLDLMQQVGITIRRQQSSPIIIESYIVDFYCLFFRFDVITVIVEVNDILLRLSWHLILILLPLRLFH